MIARLSLRAFVAICLAALGLGLGVTAVLSSPTASGQAGPTLAPPDLVQVAPYRITIVRAVERGKTKWRLSFASAVENRAPQGRVIIRGHRSSRRTQYLTADQYVDVLDPDTNEVLSEEVVRDVGQMHYAYSKTHEHFHLLRFDRYELRRVSDGGRVAHDRKTGFCLGDRFVVGSVAVRSRGVHSGPRAVAAARAIPTRDLDQDCGTTKPGLLTVTEGISPGNGDDYKPYLEGQYLDVTNLPTGRYELIHRVNSARKLRETDYSNDVASALISLRQRKPGRPTVTVLARCRGTARCTTA